MNKRKRQISKAIRERIRAEHNAMMKELFDFMDSVFAELDDESLVWEDKRAEENRRKPFSDVQNHITNS